MNASALRRSSFRLLVLCAPLALALCVALPRAALAQPPALCNGVPATITATAPGRIDGTPGPDVIVGSAGDDQIDGRGGDDLICAGPGNDTVTSTQPPPTFRLFLPLVAKPAGAMLEASAPAATGAPTLLLNGGSGNDTLIGGPGDDTFPWAPGDGSDTVEGGGGNDTLAFTTANIAESIALSANGPRLRLTRDVANITMDVAGVERVNLATLGGADTITASDLSGTDVTEVAVDLGAAGGGDGAADRVFVNGTVGDDAITLTGAAGELSAAGPHTRMSIRNGEPASDSLLVNGIDGNDTLDASGVPAGQIPLILLGGVGNDTLTGGAGNDALGGGVGADRLVSNVNGGSDLLEGGDDADTVEVNGTDAGETFTVVPNGTRVRLDATGAVPTILDIGTAEKLVVNAGGGDDSFTGANGLAALIALTVDGGAGNDTLIGGDGPDLLIGGEGADVVTGGRGDDTALMGLGDDTFRWSPGDGSDIVEGQDGGDRVQFNGSNVGEKIDLSANGARVRLTRDVANITMDMNDVERVDIAALGGADTVTVSDLTGTDMSDVNLDLAATPGGGDGAADRLIVNGTNGDDVAAIAGSSGQLTISGLAPRVNLLNAEPANDGLTVNALAGDDVVNASDLAATVVTLTADGGNGNDVMTGSKGNDTFFGGIGDDVLIGGPGQDVLDGGPGNNIIIQD